MAALTSPLTGDQIQIQKQWLERSITKASQDLARLQNPAFSTNDHWALVGKKQQIDVLQEKLSGYNKQLKELTNWQGSDASDKPAKLKLVTGKETEKEKAYREAVEKHQQISDLVAQTGTEIRELENLRLQEGNAAPEKRARALLGEAVYFSQDEIETKMQDARQRLADATRAQELTASRVATALAEVNQGRSAGMNEAFRKKQQALLDALVKVADAAGELHNLDKQFSSYQMERPHALLLWNGISYGIPGRYFSESCGYYDAQEHTDLSRFLDRARALGYKVPDGVNQELGFLTGGR